MLLPPTLVADITNQSFQTPSQNSILANKDQLKWGWHKHPDI